jgi:dimethylhistidine N-methyltransferase
MTVVKRGEASAWSKVPESASASQTFRADVLAGLSKPARAIPPKYFYDRRGSALFDQITELPEYYPTRTEISILEDRIDDIVDHMGTRVVLIEYGSGSSMKTRLILDRLNPGSSYVPIDISESHLFASVAALTDVYPDLLVRPVHADYADPVELPDFEGRRYVFYPGSTIGNFEPDRAVDFLRRVGTVIQSDGGLLIGVDLIKDASVLEAAYDDSAGVTAAFNLNLLLRMNSELGANFDLDGYQHRAVFNPAKGRVEMHLVSTRDQQVRVAGETFRFRRGEYIHTENSYKYTLDGFSRRALEAGLVVDCAWTDDSGLFAVFLMRNENLSG